MVKSKLLRPHKFLLYFYFQRSVSSVLKKKKNFFSRINSIAKALKKKGNKKVETYIDIIFQLKKKRKPKKKLKKKRKIIAVIWIIAAAKPQNKQLSHWTTKLTRWQMCVWLSDYQLLHNPNPATVYDTFLATVIK